ncbi:hypothetical protein LEP1GSC202_1272 [Leptospira yanagawae serovar Saopaulo str. Sao Paulo = ATCC 700523]|uniref:Addiction module component n=1 Tax=Leptospira yanagawae serovar Saopaulo str. Sao Paulo = ATCC 700523 TaxID=1249483 RepID=A0A5E8HFJ9_9LEPT|nr:hypothetical protein [Leptospira yanagawae]EOQ88766.1 hypothetical protein LEP1GSC202_1272 [Leptospira yanagawae serovar Saopaulo str. Sao Paulo = ATCC 700523]
MSIDTKLTIADIQKMNLSDQIETLGTIWDSIVETNQPIPLSSNEKKLLDVRFEAESSTKGINWKTFKKNIQIDSK